MNTHISMAMTQYQGVSGYKELHTGMEFVDVSNRGDKVSLNRLVAFSIVKGMGNDKFYPNRRVSKEEAIAFLVRLQGLEEMAQKEGENLIDNTDTSYYRILGPSYYWSLGYIQTAKNNGIITSEEEQLIENINESNQESLEIQLEKQMMNYEKNLDITEEQLKNIEEQLKSKLEKAYTWQGYVSREQFFIWMARVLDIEPVNGESQNMVYKYRDWSQISTANIPYIEGLIKEGILETDNKFNPKGAITRIEIARALDKVLDKVLLDRGYNIYTGEITDIDDTIITETNTSNYSNDTVNTLNRTIEVKNDNYIFVNIIAKESPIPRNDMGFIVEKNGRTYSPNVLKKGYYIKYYVTEEGKVAFAQLVDEFIF